MIPSRPSSGMQTSRRPGIAAAALGALLIMSCGGEDNEHPELRLEHTTVWMTVAQRQIAEHAVVFYNDGDGLLEITEMTVTPSWVTISPSSLLVQPGRSESATLTAVPMSAGAGIHEGRIMVTSNDPDRPLLAIPLEIRVVEGLPPSITVTPTLCVLALEMGDSTVVACTVTNSGTATAHVTQVSPQCSWVSAAPSSLSLDPGASAEISLAVQSHGLTDGRHQCTVEVHTTDPNAPRCDVVIDLTVGASGGASRIVVAEEFTGTWCQYCPGAMMGLHALQNLVGPDRVAVIVYHLSDGFTILGGQDRSQFYSVGGIPNVIFDGIVSRLGGDHDTPIDYTAPYNQRASIPAPLIISLSLTEYEFGSGSGTVRAVCQNVTTETLSARLLLVMTAVDSLYSWQGFDHLYSTAISMPLGSGGAALTLAPEASDTVLAAFSTPDGWRSRQRDLTGFAQDFGTKEIHQGSVLHLP
ncbi:hypothetical protein JXA88_17475 [Candidatus Fermentibacteria bacterium]|nr:hypothetical protein [Candidatus Fermentibacteria bacterium]